MLSNKTECSKIYLEGNKVLQEAFAFIEEHPNKEVLRRFLLRFHATHVSRRDVGFLNAAYYLQTDPTIRTFHRLLVANNNVVTAAQIVNIVINSFNNEDLKEQLKANQTKLKSLLSLLAASFNGPRDNSYLKWVRATAKTLTLIYNNPTNFVKSLLLGSLEQRQAYLKSSESTSYSLHLYNQVHALTDMSKENVFLSSNGSNYLSWFTPLWAFCLMWNNLYIYDLNVRTDARLQVPIRNLINVFDTRKKPSDARLREDAVCLRKIDKNSFIHKSLRPIVVQYQGFFEVTYLSTTVTLENISGVEELCDILSNMYAD